VLNININQQHPILSADDTPIDTRCPRITFGIIGSASGLGLS
jgi:hypothetical protein